MVSYGASKTAAFQNLRGVRRFLWWGKGWVQVGYSAEEPVLVAEVALLAGFLDLTVFRQVNEYCWRGLMFFSWAKWACGGVCWWGFVFDEVCRSSCAFSGYDNPTIQQVVFSELVVGHFAASLHLFGVGGILAFPPLCWT